MALPTYQAAGTLVATQTSGAVSWPTHAADDIGVLIIEYDPNGGTDPTGLSGWTEFTGSPIKTGTSPATSCALSVWWRRATSSSEGSITVPDCGNHFVARIVTIRGCITSGNPFDVVSSGAFSGTEDTSQSIPGATTTVADCLVLLLCANGGNFTTNSWSSLTNADLSSLTDQASVHDTIGNGGGFLVATGVKSSAGSYGTTTVTSQRTSAEASISIAFKGAAASYTLAQPNFRVRSDDSQGLNTDAGWAGSLNANVSMAVEKRFRIRFEVEETASADYASGFKLQYRKNGGTWTDVPTSGWPIPTNVTAVTLVDSDQYNDGDATTNLLSGSSRAFLAGTGEETGSTGNLTGFNNEHSEFEFSLLIRRFYETRLANNAGDTFEFRMVESGGGTFAGTYVNPTITLTVPDYLVGGCLPETPWRILYRDDNGNIYAIIEPHEINPLVAVVKSTDGGRTWAMMDASNGPTENDLEATDAVLANDRLYIVHQKSNGNVFHHVFRVSTSASNPDTWELVDQSISAGEDAITQQCVAIERRSNGDLIACFIKKPTGLNQSVFYRKKSAGAWGGSDLAVDNEDGVDFLGVTIVRAAADKIHILYNENGGAWYRTLDSGDSLSVRKTIGAFPSTSQPQIPILSLVYLGPATDEVVALGFIKDFATDGQVYTRTVTNDGVVTNETQASSGTKPARNMAGSGQVCAVLAGVGNTLHLIYGDNSTNDLYYDTNRSGSWGTDVEILDNTTIHTLAGATFVNSRGGVNTVFAYLWDNGGDGHTGFVWYGEHIIDPYHVPAPTHIRRH